MRQDRETTKIMRDMAQQLEWYQAGDALKELVNERGVTRFDELLEPLRRYLYNKATGNWWVKTEEEREIRKLAHAGFADIEFHETQIQCTRCKGTGKISYNHVNGGAVSWDCHVCSGKGFKVAGISVPEAVQHREVRYEDSLEYGP